MNKEEMLKPEIDMIQNEKYKDNLKILINSVPDYFFEIPASSTGKYHPAFASGEGGLVRHSKVACYILNEIVNTKTFGSAFTDDQKDLLRFAIMVHDGFKHGVTADKYTKHEHPLICAICLRDSESVLELTKEEIEYAASAIESHMGEWNKSDYSDVVLALPTSDAQKLVHLCDFLSSKKILDVKFDGNEIRRD